MKPSISRHLDPEEFEVTYAGNRRRISGTRRDFEDYQERRERERARKRKMKQLSRGE